MPENADKKGSKRYPSSHKEIAACKSVAVTKLPIDRISRESSR